MKNLLNKILLVMRDVEYLKKDDSVGFGSNQYKAISEEKVTSSVGDSMRKHGLVIIPIMINQKRDDIEVKRKDGTTAVDRLATVEVTYLIADPESGESLTAMSAGTGFDTQDKAIGKAMTYAYKYLLLRSFCIPTGEDPDKVASVEQPAPDQKAKKAEQPKPAAKPTEPTAPTADQVFTTDPETVIGPQDYKTLVMLCADETGKAADPEKQSIMMTIIKGLGYASLKEVKIKHFEDIYSKFEMAYVPEALR